MAHILHVDSDTFIPIGVARIRSKAQGVDIPLETHGASVTPEVEAVIVDAIWEKFTGPTGQFDGSLIDHMRDKTTGEPITFDELRDFAQTTYDNQAEFELVGDDALRDDVLPARRPAPPPPGGYRTPPSPPAADTPDPVAVKKRVSFRTPPDHDDEKQIERARKSAMRGPYRANSPSSEGDDTTGSKRSSKPGK